MALSVCGRQFHPGYELRIGYETSPDLAANVGHGERYRIVLVTAGSGMLRIDGRAYPLFAPSIYCLNERETLKTDDATDVEARALYFHPGVVNYRFQFAPPGQTALFGTDYQDAWNLEPFHVREAAYYGCLLIDPAVARHAEHVMDDLERSMREQADNDWPCRSRSYLMELLFLARRVYQNMSTPAQEVPQVSVEAARPVIQYLHTHYREKLKADELARQFNTNKTTLNTLIKMYTGQPLITYLNTIRMQMACSILRNTLLPTSEIMERVGFRDDAHFIRNFRKYAGCSPAEYRKQHCWMLKVKSTGQQLS